MTGSLKLAAGELLRDIRNSSIDAASAWFWWRRFRPIKLARRAIQMTAKPQRLLEAYALAFCLTRADARTPIVGENRDKFVDLIGDLGLTLSNTNGLHGGALRRAPNYKPLAREVFSDVQRMLRGKLGLEPFFYHLVERYVDHRPRDTDRTGFVETPQFTTVPTHQYAARANGEIWTFSQQDCVVYIFCSRDRIALGHWPFSSSTASRNRNDVQELASLHPWRLVHIFARENRSYETIRNLPVHTHQNPPDAICSIGIVKDGGGYKIFREYHLRGDIELPLGPNAVVPVNRFDCIEQVNNI